MKNLMTTIALVFTLLGFSQKTLINGNVQEQDLKIDSFAVTVTVDSAEEIESTFKVEDIEEFLENTKQNESVTFKIICNGRTMENGEKAHMSYKITGNTNAPEKFLKGVKKIRKSAIKYYKNKN